MRQSGVLAPVSCLPNRHGIGSFGRSTMRFVDLLKQGGYHLWQILPLNPLGYGHSPYQPFSSFALDEIYIDLDELSARGLLPVLSDYEAASPKVLYEEVRAYKAPFLRAAYEAEMKKNPQALDSFIASHPWVGDWAVFMMFKRSENLVSWDNWPLAKQNWIKTRPELAPGERSGYLYEIWLQYTAYAQWERIHRYANEAGIRIIGDVPFYVGFDSCDVWGSQSTFLLDPSTHQPSWIAGVPPDYFSATGQRWGNPIYDWGHLVQTGFAFIENRIMLNAGIYDILRLDHFRAYDTYWKIPASCPTAVEGTWVEAPGESFFRMFFARHKNVELIAEDLGQLRPQVLLLRDEFAFPGMNVIEFTFESAELEKKPGFDRENMVAYLGTHDNQTARGYFDSLAEAAQLAWIARLRALGYADRGGIVDSLIRYELGLKAKYAIFTLQDLLKLTDAARFNVPGVIDDVNWTWRLVDYSPFQARIEALARFNRDALR